MLLRRYSPCLPMESARRHTVATREYRLASLLLVLGALSTGVLLLERLATVFQDSVFLFDGTNRALGDQLSAGALSLTLAQISVVVIALVGTAGFALIERRRLQRLHDLRSTCARPTRVAGVARLSTRQRFETFITRTSLSGGVLLLYWILQTSWERYQYGLGWSIQYADWTSLLPLASIFGLCLLVGTVVAVISMYGLRVIFALELMLHELTRRTRRPFSLFQRRAAEHTRTARELFGYELLSRGPPMPAS